MRTSIACSIRCSVLFATSPQFSIELERVTANGVVLTINGCSLLDSRDKDEALRAVKLLAEAAKAGDIGGAVALATCREFGTVGSVIINLKACSAHTL